MKRNAAMICIRVALAAVVPVVAAEGGIVTKTVAYKHGDVVLEGFLAYDDAVKTPRPGVLVVHEWWGLGDHAKNSAKKLAGMGYVAFALDMYGKGVMAETPEKAGELSGKFKNDRKLMRERAKAGYDQLAALPSVHKSRISAIGFCFGGTTVLQMAYSGLELAGVVSFHGGLTAAGEDDLKNIKARILVLHGADDPFVKPDEIKAFQEALRTAKADWQMVYYGGAVHSFTNPAVDKASINGAKYDARADKRSEAHMKLFFDEIFAAKE